jgi:hypothetical protein
MPSPPQRVRRDLRYPLRLPVSVRLANRELHTQSENISRGILLSSTVLIPEGSAVQLAVTVANTSNPDFFLTNYGKVVRVRLKDPRDFAVAIECEQPFQIKRPSSGYSE